MTETATVETPAGRRPSDALGPAELRAILTDMVCARIWSGRLLNLQRQGRIGTYAPIDGEEAAVVGSAAALDPAVDWVVPQYREPVALSRFSDRLIDQTVLALRGHPGGAGRSVPGANVFPNQISIAAQIPHAVGLAWGLRLRGVAGVVLCFFGDGATSEGDFYEAANLAGVVRAPVVLLCLENGFAISTPRHRQTAAQRIADKALGVGMPGVQVDGNDPLAVYDAVALARQRALGGDGPTLVEALTYRLGPHTTADDPTRYRSDEEVSRRRAEDPVPRFRAELERRGLWDADQQAAVEAMADRRLDEALAAAEAAPVEPDEFFLTTFATPTPQLERQRAALLDHLAASREG